MQDKKGQSVSLLYGKNFAQTVNGNVFIGNQAAGGAVIPIYNNTTQQCGIFNPAGSGVYVVPIRINFGYVSTTGAAGSYALAYVNQGDAQIATGSSGVTAATQTTPINAKIGGPLSRVQFMSAAITTVAPTLLMQLGVNQLVTTATDATNMANVHSYDFDGSLIVPPGVSLFVVGNIALLIKLAISVVWAEVPAGVENAGW